MNETWLCVAALLFFVVVAGAIWAAKVLSALL